METVVFSVIGTPAFYIGKLVSKEASVITFTEALMGMQIQDKMLKEIVTELVKIPQASRNSKITIDASLVGGLLITNPDSDLVRKYDSDIIRLYSKLTLV